MLITDMRLRDIYNRQLDIGDYILFPRTNMERLSDLSLGLVTAAGVEVDEWSDVRFSFFRNEPSSLVDVDEEILCYKLVNINSYKEELKKSSKINNATPFEMVDIFGRTLHIGDLVICGKLSKVQYGIVISNEKIVIKGGFSKRVSTVCKVFSPTSEEQKLCNSLLDDYLALQYNILNNNTDSKHSLTSGDVYVWNEMIYIYFGEFFFVSSEPNFIQKYTNRKVNVTLRLDMGKQSEALLYNHLRTGSCSQQEITDFLTISRADRLGLPKGMVFSKHGFYNGQYLEHLNLALDLSVTRKLAKDEVTGDWHYVTYTFTKM
jgi:hypothetical protein